MAAGSKRSLRNGEHRVSVRNDVQNLIAHNDVEGLAGLWLGGNQEARPLIFERLRSVNRLPRRIDADVLLEVEPVQLLPEQPDAAAEVEDREAAAEPAQVSDQHAVVAELV